MVLAVTVIMLATAACGPDAIEQHTTAPIAYHTPTATPTRTPTPTPTPTMTPTPTPTATPTPSPVPTRVATLPPTPTPAAVARAASAGGCAFAASVEQWRSLVSLYDWDTCSALRIMQCESRGDASAVNASSGACGLWQHLPCQHNGDPGGSTALAYAKYASRGWQPWTVGGCFP